MTRSVLSWNADSRPQQNEQPPGECLCSFEQADTGRFGQIAESVLNGTDSRPPESYAVDQGLRGDTVRGMDARRTRA